MKNNNENNPLKQPAVGMSMVKLQPKEWFEQIELRGCKVMWGTNSFSDIACMELIEKYIEYLNA